MKKDIHKYSNFSARVIDDMPGEISVFFQGENLIESIKVAAQFLGREFDGYTLNVSSDYGEVKFTVERFERNLNITAVDFFSKIWELRKGVAPQAKHFIIDGGDHDSLNLVFKNNDNIGLYEAAIDAALVSRENDNKIVEFVFRGRRLVLTGKTPPESIEKLFPENERLRFDQPKAQPIRFNPT